MSFSHFLRISNKIIRTGKQIKNENNGASVNFRGFLGDTAAVWSAILLDQYTLEVLLNHGSDLHNIGITQSSLLHWVVLAGSLEESQSGKRKANFYNKNANRKRS